MDASGIPTEPVSTDGERPGGARGDTRTRILTAAVDLFGTEGLAGASTHAIARRAGARQSLVGYHFGGKDALWTAALAEAQRRLYRSLADAVPPVGGFGSAERVLQLMQAMRADERAVRLLLRAALADGHGSPPRLGAMAAALGRALPQGDTPTERPALAAWLASLLASLLLKAEDDAALAACEPLAQWWQSLAHGGGPYSLAAARRRRLSARGRDGVTARGGVG